MLYKKERKLRDQSRTTVLVTKTIKEESNNKLILIKNSWNFFAKKHSLKTIIRLTTSRSKKLNLRLKEPDFDFPKILDAAGCQPFLINGSNHNPEHGNWRINFDWLIHNDINYVKVLEYRYKTESHQPKQSQGDLEYQRTQQYLRNLENARIKNLQEGALKCFTKKKEN